MKTVTVVKADKTLFGKICLPSSKSISNRLLILNALSVQQIGIQNLSESDDTILLAALLKIVREGYHGHPVILDTGNAGTVMRFLTSLASITPGKWIMTGSERMKQRPIGALIDALGSLGVEIEYLGDLGYPPLLIKGKAIKGSDISIDAAISSQFISALLLIAPVIEGGLKIHLAGSVVSQPYIQMTLQLLQYFGIFTKTEGNAIIVPEHPIEAKNITVEADWSSAAFWYEAAALADDVDLILEGLPKDSFQGDSIISEIFNDFGVKSEFLPDGIRLTKSKKKAGSCFFDFTGYPDIAPAIMTTCAALGIQAKWVGLKSLIIKESNRVEALLAEFSKMMLFRDSGLLSEQDPVIELSSQSFTQGSDYTIDTYKDHRIAMSFAPLALIFGRININDPDVVKKSYPNYWNDMISLGFEIS